MTAFDVSVLYQQDILSSATERSLVIRDSSYIKWYFRNNNNPVTKLGIRQETHQEYPNFYI